MILPQAISFCRTSCGLTRDTGGIPGDELRNYWSQANSIDLPSGTAMTSTMVFRIKSYLNDDVTKIYIDDVKISYTGGSAPQLSEDTVIASSDPVNTATVNETDFQGFASTSDWGIWRDGGRNVYITDYLALDDNYNSGGYGACLRNFFSGKSNGTSDGVDLGFQKPTYSSIVTNNLDFTETEDLDLAFSFVSYNMKMKDDHILDTAQVPNIDGDFVNVYVPGPDYVDISISTDAGYTFKHIKRLTYGEDFLNLVRQNIIINIPGNILANDDTTGNVILNTASLTTTTQIKIQCFSDTDEQQFYIDNLTLTQYGSKSSPKGTPRDLNWESYEQTYLYADPSQMGGDAYEYINSKLLDPQVYESGSWRDASNDADLSTDIPGAFGCVEHSDCSDHSTLTDVSWTEGQRHIEQVMDETLGKYTFNFHSHLNEDTERCRTDDAYDDRMRCEIKTKHDSKDAQKGIQGETHFYAWKMKLPSDFKGSNKFTHLHQIKPVAGDHFGMPTITLTATSKVDAADADGEVTSSDTGEQVLKLRYAGLSDSQVTVDVIDLNLLKGKWIQFVEKVHFDVSDKGRYELLAYDPINGSINDPIFTFESYSLQTWKASGESGDISDADCFVRPKWGIYRSNVEAEKLGNEIIGFADFIMLEVTDLDDGRYGDITKFAEYIEVITPDNDYNNIALLGTATQSTDAHGGIAQRAIDDDQNGRWSNGSVTHTESGIGEWWEVALDETYIIGDIVIYNRTDNCCVDRLENFTVNVLDDNRNVTYTYTSTTTVSGSLTLNANEAIGSYVQIVQDESSPLSLAEVKVFGVRAVPIGKTIQLRKGGGNNRFVTAEQSANDNQLIARATSLGAWEQFIVEEHPNGGVALFAKSNNKYVQVQGNNQNAPVRAAGNAMGTWEQFEWVPLGDGKVALKSTFTGKWIQANWNTTNAVLYPKGAAVGTWETFLFEVIDSDLLKDDLEFLDPYDDQGNKWFETAQDKTDFLNAILTATGTTANTAPASLKNDLFVASVRSDDDGEYDNKNYHTIVLVKSDTMNQAFNDLAHNFPDRHVYTVNFYLGENMTYAEFLLDEDVPTGYWGESLINLPYREILTATDVNASRNIWVNITSDFNSIMNSLTLWGN
ncbi:MAG: discoidin domain-containing protein [Kordia sp.]|uniref:galactose-binding domain-containing protein n=1 Tax=Kordia sp. TaxID=1965332 RepID=UPI00385C5FA7